MAPEYIVNEARNQTYRFLEAQRDKTVTRGGEWAARYALPYAWTWFQVRVEGNVVYRNPAPSREFDSDVDDSALCDAAVSESGHRKVEGMSVQYGVVSQPGREFTKVWFRGNWADAAYAARFSK